MKSSAVKPVEFIEGKKKWSRNVKKLELSRRRLGLVQSASSGNGAPLVKRLVGTTITVNVRNVCDTIVQKYNLSATVSYFFL